MKLVALDHQVDAALLKCEDWLYEEATAAIVDAAVFADGGDTMRLEFLAPFLELGWKTPIFRKLRMHRTAIPRGHSFGQQIMYRGAALVDGHHF